LAIGTGHRMGKNGCRPFRAHPAQSRAIRARTSGQHGGSYRNDSQTSKHDDEITPSREITLFEIVCALFSSYGQFCATRPGVAESTVDVTGGTGRNRR
jgi:hypothetical protein